jgi:toxin FitB
MTAALNVVDSSGWLEILVGGPNAAVFEQVIAGGKLIVPTISVFEVAKRALLLGTEKDAERIEKHMLAFRAAELTLNIASAAARLSVKHKLPMADSIIYATARAFDATLWTQDADFASIKGVKYFAKQPA